MESVRLYSDTVCVIVVLTCFGVQVYVLVGLLYI